MASEIEILGSYFPGWLLATILGIILAGCSRVVLAKTNLHAALITPLLFYGCLAFLWGLLCFGVFFS